MEIQFKQRFNILWPRVWTYIWAGTRHLHFQLCVIQQQFLQRPWLYLQSTEQVQLRQHLRENIPGRIVQFHTRRSRNFLRNKLKNNNAFSDIDSVSRQFTSRFYKTGKRDATLQNALSIQLNSPVKSRLSLLRPLYHDFLRFSETCEP